MSVRITQAANSSLPAGAAQTCVREFGATPVSFAGASRILKSIQGRSRAPAAPAVALDFTTRELAAAISAAADTNAARTHDTFDTATAYYATIDPNGEKATFLQTSLETAGERSAFEVEVRPGGGVPRHQHSDHDELIEVIAGILRIALDSADMQIDDRLVRLSPGMAVTAEIKTGSRRIINYLLSPLLRYSQESLRER